MSTSTGESDIGAEFFIFSPTLQAYRNFHFACSITLPKSDGRRAGLHRGGKLRVPRRRDPRCRGRQGQEMRGGGRRAARVRTWSRACRLLKIPHHARHPTPHGLLATPRMPPRQRRGQPPMPTPAPKIAGRRPSSSLRRRDAPLPSCAPANGACRVSRSGWGGIRTKAVKARPPRVPPPAQE